MKILVVKFSEDFYLHLINNNTKVNSQIRFYITENFSMSRPIVIQYSPVLKPTIHNLNSLIPCDIDPFLINLPVLSEMV